MDMQSAFALLQALRGNSLAQPVADLKNQRPWESGGGAPTNSVYVPKGYGSEGATRQFGGAQASRRDAIAQGLKDGKTYDQIAKELGISRNAVAGSVRDLGLTKEPLGQRDPYTLDPVELEESRTRLNPGEQERQRALVGLPKSKAPVSLPQVSIQKQPAPAEDPEMAQMMTNYLKNLGIVE